MKTYFTIGETSELFNISIQALRYYDKIGLLKPNYVNGQNSYRYYTIKQFEQLDTIIYLKELGFSLTDIKDCLYKHNIETTREILRTHQKLITSKIQNLESINRRISDKINNLNRGMRIQDFDSINEKTIEEREFVYLELVNPSRVDISSFAIASKYFNYMVTKSVDWTNVAMLLSKESILANNYYNFKAACFDVKLFDLNTINKDLIRKFPKGEYACIYHKGAYSETYKSYAKLLEYFGKNNYSIDGDTFELYIVDCSITGRDEEFITEIQIPINKH